MKELNKKTKCNFYVHTKSKSGWTLPIFNRHGIDITCGDKNCFGGILIREIKNPNNKEGSGLTLRSILRGDLGYNPIQKGMPGFGWSEKEKEILSKLNNASIFKNSTPIMIKKSANQNITIYKGERVGVEKTKYGKLKLRFSTRKFNDSFERINSYT